MKKAIKVLFTGGTIGSAAIDGKVDLYYTDESHVCTDGYVPYGWQFKDENVYIPSEKTQNLRHNYPKKSIQGFTTQESINADRLMDFLDRLSFEVKKKTVVVLDNASVHRNRKIKEMRKIWEDKGLFLFYLPPLWRILKGKWIRPAITILGTRYSIVQTEL